MTVTVPQELISPAPDGPGPDLVLTPQAEVPPKWAARLHETIVSRVRAVRRSRNMSARQVAERTTELGMAIPRPVLANLESGRRTYLTVAELLILAKALGVAPGDLLIPVGRDAHLEVAPGDFRSPEDVARWFWSPRCAACDDEPPAGFTCDTCGKSGSRDAPPHSGPGQRDRG